MTSLGHAFPAANRRSHRGVRSVATSPGRAADLTGRFAARSFISVAPNWSSDRPPTNELRGRLGYRRVTVTDAIEAGALAGFGTYGQRAVLAAQAGMDLLLCAAQDVSQGQSVTQALASALDGGRLNAGDFTAAVRRITALRNALHRAGAAAPG